MTLRDYLNEATAILGQDRRFDLERLAAYFLGVTRAHLLADLNRTLEVDQEVPLQAALRALIDGTPLQYLIQEAWFMGRAFYVDERVLIPRYDTETLAQAVLDQVKGSGRLLDLCTGSGALAVSLALSCPAWTIFASDISPGALTVARYNAEQLGARVYFRQGDLFSPWFGEPPFDCIVSNPPYISLAEYDALTPEVQREPAMALLGGEDGLDFYRRICGEAPDFLKSGGRLMVEIGAYQGEAVQETFARSGFQKVAILRDANNRSRVVQGHYEPHKNKKGL